MSDRTERGSADARIPPRYPRHTSAALCAVLAASFAFPALAQPAPDILIPAPTILPALTDDQLKQAANARPIDRICDLIETHAVANALPKEFFARLIWKESRFNEKAVSPVGAQGIAQFMPGTAKMVGLADPFDMEQAIPASARHLADLKGILGNLGLAAAAYNAGEGRINRWLSSGGFLPLETENYVLDILGEPADNFTDRKYAGTNRALDEKTDFRTACRNLPIIMSRTVPMAQIHTKPWGVQVAGNFRRSAAVNQWQRERGRFAILKKYEPVVSRIRTPIGRRGVYAVRIGVDNRKAADQICAQLRSAGGACVVMRNR